MLINSTDISGVYVIDLEKREDDRGFFARNWCRQELLDSGIEADFVQANVSGCKKKGTIRGLHYQIHPHGEAKLIRCTRGAIFDVIVDMRAASPTYRNWLGFELAADQYRMVYVPEGIAHGYQSLEDDTEIYYPVTGYYAPDWERGLRWDDPTLNINWPITRNVILSEKDASWPDFSPSRSQP